MPGSVRSLFTCKKLLKTDKIYVPREREVYLFPQKYGEKLKRPKLPESVRSTLSPEKYEKKTMRYKVPESLRSNFTSSNLLIYGNSKNS